MSVSNEKCAEPKREMEQTAKNSVDFLSPLSFNTLPFSLSPSNTNTPRECSSSTILSPQYNPLNLEFFDVMDDDFEIQYDDETDLTLCIDKVYVTDLMAQYPESSASLPNNDGNDIQNVQNDQETKPMPAIHHKKFNYKNSSFKNRNATFSYSPHPKYKTQKFITISRILTQHIIPNKVHPHIQNVYSFINKSTVMVHRCRNCVYFNNNSSVIYNYDLYDKQTGEILYCIADKKWSKKNNQYHYKMRDQLYTQQDIKQLQVAPIYLPPSSRYLYDKILSEKAAIERILCTEIMNIMDKVKWNRVRIFNDALSDNKQCRAQYNTKRLTFYVKTHAFNDVIHEFLCRVPQCTLVPIIMFVLDENCCDYRVEYVQIVRIADKIDIGISYFYDSCANQITVTGIHVNKSRIMEQHQLISPHHDCHCLDNFESRINDIRIGNPDDDLNRFKDIKRRMQSKDNMIKYLQKKMHKLEMQLKNTPKANDISVQNSASSAASTSQNNLQNNAYVNNVNALPNNIALPNYHPNVYPFYIGLAPVPQHILRINNNLPTIPMIAPISSNLPFPNTISSILSVPRMNSAALSRHIAQ